MDLTNWIWILALLNFWVSTEAHSLPDNLVMTTGELSTCGHANLVKLPGIQGRSGLPREDNKDVPPPSNGIYVVELLVVVEKGLADKFGQDRKKILEYLSVYYSDVNLRFKTLRSVKVSFRVTDVKAISDIRDQRFIEDIRHPNGRVSYDSLIRSFNEWLYRKFDGIPKFDVAVLMTNTQDVGKIGGIAYLEGACQPVGYGRGVIIRDFGGWDGIPIAAHELGHSLGAYHDDNKTICSHDGNRPNNLMGSMMKEERMLYFSECSDRMIAKFVRSRNASCLRISDYNGQLPISSDFSYVAAPTMTKQCKIIHNDSDAFVSDKNSRDCNQLNCVSKYNSGLYSIPSLVRLDNFPCGGDGRCFRGQCRKSASLVQNAGSGKCLKLQDNSTVVMSECVSSLKGTLLDRFMMKEGNHGPMLATPSPYDSFDVCIYIKGKLLLTTPCDLEDAKLAWHLAKLGNTGEFMFRHVDTKRCIRQEKNEVRVYSSCKETDAYMRWKFV